MVDYLYDNTFEGFLTCVYHHYYSDKASGIFSAREYQSTMLGGFQEIVTDESKATTVYEAINKKISSYDLGRVYKAFLSTVDQKETKILNYLRLGFVKGSSISMLHGDPIVFAVQDAEKKVNAEIHRFNGLIRFSELGNQMMYSSIEPDHDIVEFFADHFTDRFRGEPFIIHDVKRDKALMAYQREWYISEFTADDLPGFSEGEVAYRKLWKHYFENIAIKERINPRCQRNMMPARYWKNLPELQP